MCRSKSHHQISKQLDRATWTNGNDPKSSRAGFTIVELLIVIVVIGILAAIVIVSYNGIRDRAEQARDVSLVKGYINALNMYMADNGSFPNIGASGNIIAGTGDATLGGTCLGPASLFPSGKCGNGWGWYENTVYSSEVNNALQSLASLSGTPVSYQQDGSDPKGVVWYHSNFYLTGHHVIGYSVPPSQNCGLSNIWDKTTKTVNPNLSYTTRNSQATYCIVSLDN